MTGPNSSPDSSPRVVPFRPGRNAAQKPPASPSPAENLSKFEGGPEDAQDYRHRMLVNAAAFLFVIALIGGAIWLADTMASMRKNQDCVLSGRRGCSPVEAGTSRW